MADSLTPTEHIERGEEYLEQSRSGFAPQKALDLATVAGVHFAAATAKLLLLAQEARKVQISLVDLADALENDDEDPKVKG